ncbi:MAG: thioredoxin [Deltaproteobacteria bacterium]|jgi:thioredoxin 1/putative thioredoxin|nr:thioredoxin [Deltaproteobacteria bacterium]MBW2535096.1 thioredoxin [Deltaproteobacteria bacterium]
MALKVVGEQDFEAEVLRSDLPVLVDFFADWCQPCKVAAPEVEAIAAELQGKAKVVKVDIDQSQRLATMLRIASVPTFMVFAQGRPVAAEQGAVKRDRLRAMLEPFLPRAAGAVRAAELAELLQQPGVVPVDTRDAHSYGRAHIPKAVHMPLEEIESRLAELHMLGTPVLYCRAGDKSKELSEKLAADGIPVTFLEGGMLGWESEFLPIERGDD